MLNLDKYRKSDEITLSPLYCGELWLIITLFQERVLRDSQKSVKRRMKNRMKVKSYILTKDSGMSIQDYVQEEGRLIPQFVTLCAKFIESEGE